MDKGFADKQDALNYFKAHNDDIDVFVLPAKIGSDVWLIGSGKIEYGVVEGYKITEHGAYCYGSISIPSDDDPKERLWDRNFGIDVDDFGKTVFLSLSEAESLLSTEERESIELCEGCLSKDCDCCPKDDGYKCRFCPCDTCKVVDGKRTNWYDSYTVRYN